MYIYIVTLLVKNTENISEFLLYYLVNLYTNATNIGIVGHIIED